MEGERSGGYVRKQVSQNRKKRGVKVSECRTNWKGGPFCFAMFFFNFCFAMVFKFALIDYQEEGSETNYQLKLTLKHQLVYIRVC